MWWGPSLPGLYCPGDGRECPAPRHPAASSEALRCSWVPTLLLRGLGWFLAQGGHCPPVPRRSVESCLCPWGQGAERWGVPQLLPSVSPPLSQFTADLHKHPEILNVSDSDVLHNFLNSNFSLPNASILLQQLDTIDNAACGWVHFMAKVRLCPPVGIWVLERHPLPAARLCGAEEGSGPLRPP